MPYVCNKGRAVAVDGRQPFLPVGIPAVNSGSVVGATPCLALWRPPAAGWPAALCGSWLWQGSVELGTAPPLQDLAGQGAGLVSLAQGETEVLGGLEHLPRAGLRGRDG